MVDVHLSEIKKEILELIPQQKPFRFVNEITEIAEDRVTGKYTYTEDEYFYKGHFPGNPITPGVILIETMAQIGLVALGIYLHRQEGGVENVITLFAEADVEFYLPVLPGSTIVVTSKKIFYRRKKLKAEVEMRFENGDIIARGNLSGVGVLQNVGK